MPEAHARRICTLHNPVVRDERNRIDRAILALRSIRSDGPVARSRGMVGEDAPTAQAFRRTTAPDCSRPESTLGESESAKEGLSAITQATL
jgi:hypothetical protein